MNDPDLMDEQFSAGNPDYWKSPNFHYVKKGTISQDSVENLCNVIFNKMGKYVPILFITDTARPAMFHALKPGESLDDVAITKLVRPYAEVCDKFYPWVTHLIMYHNSRGKDDYYGSGAWMNLLKFFWNYKREKKKTIATMDIQTRRIYETVNLLRTNSGNFENAYIGIFDVCKLILDKFLERPNSERDLIKQFNSINRDTIRLAMKKIEDFGLLEDAPKKKRKLVASYKDKWNNLTNDFKEGKV